MPNLNLLEDEVVACAIDMANSGKFAESLQSLQAYISHHPDSVVSLRAYADTLYIALNSHANKASELSFAKKTLSFAEKIFSLPIKDPQLFHRIGLCLFSIGENTLALTCFNRAIHRDMCLIEAYVYKAKCSLRMQNPQQALLIVSEALCIDPTHSKVLALKGQIFFEQGRYHEALNEFTLAQHHDRKRTDLILYIARCHFALKQLTKALDLFQMAEKSLSLDVQDLVMMGLCLHGVKRYEEAISLFSRAIEINPMHEEALFHRGNSYFAIYDDERSHHLWSQEQSSEALDPYFLKENSLSKCQKALLNFKRAFAINPKNIESIYNIGACLYKLNQVPEALSFFDKVISQAPECSLGYKGKATCLVDLNRHQEALPLHEKSIQINPLDYETQWNFGNALIALGDFKRGWELYESRFFVPNLEIKLKPFTQPRLDHLNVRGKVVFVYHEQGLGDTIQFCRYVKLLKDLGAYVIFEVQKPLVSLIRTLDGDIEVIPQGQIPAYFDYHIQLISLIRLFDLGVANTPLSTAYLSADSKKVNFWKCKLAESGKFKIGLVLTGNPRHTKDALRSLNFSDIAPFKQIDAEFHLLQKEIRPRDVEPLSRYKNIKLYLKDLEDFSDTSALVQNMDLIISVDTSIAHLAGALGKEVWILLPFSADYRWLKEGETTPWYDSARLFRQDARGAWNNVIDRVCMQLNRKMTKKP